MIKAQNTATRKITTGDGVYSIRILEEEEEEEEEVGDGSVDATRRKV